MKNEILEKNVFIYWEGKEFSLIKILRKIIYEYSDNGKNFNVFFLNDKNVSNFIKIPKNYDNLSLPHKADYIRVATIKKFGGIWLDSDTLLLSDLNELFKIIEETNGFFILENNLKICNGVFGSKKETELMKKWLEKIIYKIENKKNLSWTDLGSSILNSQEFASEIKSYTILKGLDTVYPVNWNNCVEQLILSDLSNISDLEKQFQPLLILVNSVYRYLENYSEEEILELKNPLAYFLKKSLKGVKNENI